MKRLNTLDYLRGLAAFGIMLYHYLTWMNGAFDAGTFFGRIGIYGVSIFYILSGLTLYYVYESKLDLSLSSILDFFKKRIFRIFPLLWVATIGAVILTFSAPSIPKLLLNLSGLFGFFAWDQYYATGAWSIGNELVFYAFFPLILILLSRQSKAPSLVFLASVLLVFFYFAFYVLSDAQSLDAQWRNYVNPLNQLIFFCIGILIGKIFTRISVAPAVNYLIGCAGLMVFVLFPVEGNAIELVTGVNRIVFTLSCSLICFSFFKLNIQFNNYINWALQTLGEISYSVYLLHPIVFSAIKFSYLAFGSKLISLSEVVIIIISVVTTLVVSYFTYHYFEKYFLRIGKGPVLRYKF